MNSMPVSCRILNRCALTFGLICLSTSLYAEENPENPAALIKQLGSDEYDIRRAAAVKLVALGETARAALEQAAAAEDLELRQAASALLQKIDKSNVILLAFDRDGKPAGGAEGDVKLYSANLATGINWNEPRSENVVLKADGSAKLPDQAPGMMGLQFTWKKWAPARDNVNYWNMYLDRGTTPFIMTLTRGGTVNVAIQDADGKPLKDAQAIFYATRKFEPELLELQLSCSENWDRNMVSATSDATGVAKYEGLADGAYQCIIKASDFRTAVGAAFRVHEGEVLDLAAVKLTPRNNGKIQFMLKKADGTVLKKTRVNVQAEYLFEGPRAAELQRSYRQLKTQLNMQRQGDWPETDEEGKITLEDQRPGKYRLAVSSSGDTAFEPTELTVVAGQAADAGALKVVAGGTIKGKLLDSKGKGMQYCTIYAIPQEDAVDYDDGEPVMDWRFMYQQFNGRSAMQSQADGTYEIKNLRPGKYALSIQTRTGQPMVVYGIDVETGKTAAVADATVPGPPINTGGGTNKMVKGTVLMPDGKPAVGANIGMISGFSRWGRNTDDKGVFEMNVGDQWQPTRLVIKAAECKPMSVDLSAPGTKLTDLTIQLEKQEYGDVRIKIVDESGKALSGVNVRPAGKANRNVYYRQYVTDLKVISNREGIARFTGLAAGPRALQFEKDGYYAAGEVKATVLPGKECELTVTMKKGYVINGKIELPEGGDLEHSTVFLTDAKSRIATVDKDGKFQVSGMAPGDYYFTPISPGLIPQGRQKVSVKADGKVTLDGDPKDTEVKLKMGKPAGTAISLGADFAGYQASLVPKGSWDPQAPQDPNAWAQSGHSSVDASGRAEFCGTGVSEFDLVLNPAQVPYYNYRYYNSGTKKATASLVGGAVKTQILKNTAEMKTLPATEYKLEAPSGRVSGRLVCEPNIGGANINYGNLTLKIVGQKGFASVSYSYPTEFFQQGQRQPIVLGTPPTGMKVTGDFGNFQIQGLPPGEYKLYIDLTPYNYSPFGTTMGKSKTSAAPISTCTVKAGEHVNLGTVKYTLPAAVVSEMKNMGEAQLETEPEDRMQLFQP